MAHALQWFPIDATLPCMRKFAIIVRFCHRIAMWVRMLCRNHLTCDLSPLFHHALISLQQATLMCLFVMFTAGMWCLTVWPQVKVSKQADAYFRSHRTDSRTWHCQLPENCQKRCWSFSALPYCVQKTAKCTSKIFRGSTRLLQAKLKKIAGRCTHVSEVLPLSGEVLTQRWFHHAWKSFVLLILYTQIC